MAAIGIGPCYIVRMRDMRKKSSPPPHRRTLAILALLLAGLALFAGSTDTSDSSMADPLLSPPLDEQRAALLARYGGAFLSLGGVRTHYYDFGDATAGRTLVFLHGICGTGKEAECFAPYLVEAGYRVLSPDWPGAGISDLLPEYSMDAMEAWFEEFRIALGIESFALVGHSYGGFLSARYVVSHPGRVERLVLVDPAGYRAELGPLMKGLAESAPAVDAAAALYEPWYYSVVSSLQAVKDPSRVPKDVTDYAAAALATDNGRRGIRQIVLKVVGDTPDIDCLGSIDIPVLLFWAEEDRVLPYSFHGKFLKALPVGAAFRPVSDCGHSPHREKPSETAADILRFLALPR